MSSLVCFFCFLLEHDCIVTIIFNCIVLVESLCHTSFNLSKDLDFNIVAFYHLSYHGTKCGAGDLYIFLLQVTFKQLLLDTPFFYYFFFCTVLPKSTFYEAGLLFYGHLRTAHHAKRLLSERYAGRLTQCIPPMEGCNVSHCISGLQCP